MLYRINFENVSDATAPAQRINITDTLPPTLDPRTVRLQEVGFKQYRFVIPANQSFYQQRVQLNEDVGNLKADISAGLDIVNGKVFWTITAIDPNTGDRPTDPLQGILPPNNENADGEGYVIFTVEPSAGLANRSEINNIATIIFDENEPIETNTTTNLLDNGVPTSAVAPLPSTSEVQTFNVNWSGTEEVDGSGFASFDVYVSENGGSYGRAFSNTTETSGTFTGKWGKNYRFYSIAKDNAGNSELPPNMPDAEITVLGGDTEGDLAPRPNGSDGTIDGTDTAQVRRFAAGLDTDFTYNEFQRADSAPLADGGNGGLTIADVVQTRRFADGLDPNASAIGPNAATPFSAMTKKGKTAELLPRELRPVRVTRVGDQLLLAIELESQGDEVGLGFTIDYDPSILSNPTNAAAGSDAAGANVTVNTSQANLGQVGVLIDKGPLQPFAAGTKQVLTITFDISLTAPVSTVVSLTGAPVTAEVVDGLANPLTTTFSPGAIQLLSPTAAGVSVSGRVLAETGRAIPRAIVSVTNGEGVTRTARTNQFGYYNFEDVVAGGVYIFTVNAKEYQTLTQAHSVVADIAGLDFVLLAAAKRNPAEEDKTTGYESVPSPLFKPGGLLRETHAASR